MPSLKTPRYNPYQTPLTLHTHRCPECGLVWEHDPENMKNYQQFDQGHHCPKCHAEQYWLDHSGAMPACRYEGGHSVVWYMESPLAKAA